MCMLSTIMQSMFPLPNNIMSIQAQAVEVDSMESNFYRDSPGPGLDSTSPPLIKSRAITTMENVSSRGALRHVTLLTPHTE